ncbi:MAG: hypothetical protein M3Z21_14325 [Pseudomonadota bacterium]|nr:hypothetical protein [Pseudomonadota bacterium]
MGPNSMELFEVQLQTLRLHPHFSQLSDQRPLPDDFVAEVNHTVALLFANGVLPVPVRLNVPFQVQTLVMAGGVVADRLGDNDIGGQFVVELPTFPHCFPQGSGMAGATVPVRFDGLLPNRGIHALLGPDRVLDGDIQALFAARNTPAPAGDVRDIDGDGLATVNDARRCAAECTNPNCVP